MAENMQSEIESKNESLLQFLTFTLENEVFGFDVEQVKEILEFQRPVKVPLTPDYLAGVINLRGTIIPVIDLKRKFELKLTEEAGEEIIIVVDMIFEGEEFIYGILADSVKEVMDMPSSLIEDPPKIGANYKASLLKGVGKSESGIIMLLDVEKIVNSINMSIGDEK
ncbi:MAG TPA: chemotaxis protein CheW [Ignavibacteriales bacterium]|nr:chemotaxis protein CheW [Ignavibacteriales bacterium]